MKDATLAELADANYSHAFGLLGGARGRQTQEWDGLVAIDIGAPIPMFNAALITRPLTDPQGSVRRAVEFFDERGSPFHLRVRTDLDPAAEEAARDAGLVATGVQPGMTLHPMVDGASSPSDLAIETVGDHETYDTYIEIMAQGFGAPLPLLKNLFPEKWNAVDGVYWYLGSVDGRPVTTAGLIMDDNQVAGVYNISTIESARKRGLGEAMTWHAVREGQRMGAEVAILQASDMGLPIYERMGFRTTAPYQIYERRP